MAPPRGQSSTGIFTGHCARMARRSPHMASKPRFTERKMESGASSTCTTQRIASQPPEGPAKELGTQVRISHLPLATALNPPARQAEPRLGTVAAELGGMEFDNFERWFD